MLSLLASVELFQDFNIHEIAYFLDSSEPRDFEAGELVVSETELGLLRPAPSRTLEHAVYVVHYARPARYHAAIVVVFSGQVCQNHFRTDRCVARESFFPLAKSWNADRAAAQRREALHDDDGQHPLRAEAAAADDARGARRRHGAVR